MLIGMYVERMADLRVAEIQFAGGQADIGAAQRQDFGVTAGQREVAAHRVLSARLPVVFIRSACDGGEQLTEHSRPRSGRIRTCNRLRDGITH